MYTYNLNVVSTFQETWLWEKNQKMKKAAKKHHCSAGVVCDPCEKPVTCLHQYTNFLFKSNKLFEAAQLLLLLNSVEMGKNRNPFSVGTLIP